MKLAKINAPELEVIEKGKAEKIKTTFEPMVKMLTEFEKEYNELMEIPLSEITLELTQKYKRLRLDIGKVRIETGKLKDKQKEYIKLEDKAIMGVHNILVWAVKEKEDNLKERENHFENIEKERIETLQGERVLILSDYMIAAEMPANLGTMQQNVFDNFVTGEKIKMEAVFKAEQLAEEQRIEQEKKDLEAKIKYEKEQELIRKENIRLKKEADEKEAERLRLEKVREAKEEKDRKERERLAKIEADKLEKVRLEAKAKEDKLNAELKRVSDEKEAERVRIINEEIAEKNKEKAAKLAPDKEKLIILANQLKDFELPKLNSPEAIAILANVKKLLAKTNVYIIENINKV